MSNEKKKYHLAWYDHPCLVPYNENDYEEFDRKYFEKNNILLLTEEEFNAFIRIEEQYDEARDRLNDLQNEYSETISGR